MATISLSISHAAHTENPVLCPQCKTQKRHFVFTNEGGAMCSGCAFPAKTDWTAVVKELGLERVCEGCGRYRKIFSDRSGLCLKCMGRDQCREVQWVLIPFGQQDFNLMQFRTDVPQFFFEFPHMPADIGGPGKSIQLCIEQRVLAEASK